MSVDLNAIAQRDAHAARERAQGEDTRAHREAHDGGCPRLRWWDTTDDTDIPSAELLDGERVVASIHRERLSAQGGFEYAVCDSEGTVQRIAHGWAEAKEHAERWHAEAQMRAADRLADEVAW